MKYTDPNFLKATIKMYTRQYKRICRTQDIEAERLLNHIEKLTQQYIELTNDLPDW